MYLDKFSERTARIFMLAQSEAYNLGHPYVGTEHLLLAICRAPDENSTKILNRHQIYYQTVLRIINRETGTNIRQSVIGSPLPTERTKRVIEFAFNEITKDNREKIMVEDILIGILKEENGIASKVFSEMKTNKEQIIKELKISINMNRKKYRIINPVTKETNKQKSSIMKANEQETDNKNLFEILKRLKSFGTDITEIAREGRLDPIIGREKEKTRLMEILTRRKKNNPVLVGDPGVGKTAIVEGLAQMIVDGVVPKPLENKVIFALDLPALVAGTKYRGEFEKRIVDLVNILKNNKEIILFIDEIHNLVGAGSAEGTMDAANTLKPALASGAIKCIGATTAEEYRKYIEKDMALERRFQKISVSEPTIKVSIEILKGIKSKYEKHHKVKFSQEALEKSVRLSKRYVSERYLPDKAIDVIDEIGSRYRLKKLVLPSKLKKLQSEIQEIEAKGYDGEEIDNEYLAKIKEKYIDAYNRWKDRAENEIIKIEGHHVEEMISNWTGIPLNKLGQNDKQKLLNLEYSLHKRIISQDEAIKAIAKALRRSRSGIKDPNKPIGSFLFLGPTGVGKTELAKVLSEYLFDDEKKLIRIDMSEYMEKFSVSRLIGAPPGYVGYDQGGTLTEMIRKKPYSVILFDEIEKAHIEVFNILLQIMDDGRLTDSYGHIVDFRNTIIIMTSNIGGSFINKTKSSLGFTSSSEESESNYKKMKEIVMDKVKKTFRPEFINRIDEIVVFKQLNRNEIKEIIDLLFTDIQKRLGEMHINIVLDDTAREYILNNGYDPVFGARPLKRAIQKNIEDTLSESLLREEILPHDNIIVKAQNGSIIFERVENNILQPVK
jgi:ATP-dependent Clp protease ATP-binding subunit ClpC